MENNEPEILTEEAIFGITEEETESVEEVEENVSSEDK